MLALEKILDDVEEFRILVLHHFSDGCQVGGCHMNLRLELVVVTAVVKDGCPTLHRLTHYRRARVLHARRRRRSLPLRRIIPPVEKLGQLVELMDEVRCIVALDGHFHSANPQPAHLGTQRLIQMVEGIGYPTLVLATQHIIHCRGNELTHAIAHGIQPHRVDELIQSLFQSIDRSVARVHHTIASCVAPLVALRHLYECIFDPLFKPFHLSGVRRLPRRPAAVAGAQPWLISIHIGCNQCVARLQQLAGTGFVAVLDEPVHRRLVAPQPAQYSLCRAGFRVTRKRQTLCAIVKIGTDHRSLGCADVGRTPARIQTLLVRVDSMQECIARDVPGRADLQRIGGASTHDALHHVLRAGRQAGIADRYVAGQARISGHCWNIGNRQGSIERRNRHDAAFW